MTVWVSWSIVEEHTMHQKFNLAIKNSLLGFCKEVTQTLFFQTFFYTSNWHDAIRNPMVCIWKEWLSPLAPLFVVILKCCAFSFPSSKIWASTHPTLASAPSPWSRINSSVSGRKSASRLRWWSLTWLIRTHQSAGPSQPTAPSWIQPARSLHSKVRQSVYHPVVIKCFYIWTVLLSLDIFLRSTLVCKANIFASRLKNAANLAPHLALQQVC